MRFAALAAAALALASCKGGNDARQTAAASSPNPEGARTSAPAPGSCPRTGHWGECQIFARLDQSGLAPQSTTESIGDLPNLGVTPLLFTLGRSGMAFYVFPDSLARHKAATTLDTLKFIPQSKTQSIKAEPTLIQSDNGLAILFSRNDHQRERVSDAITAGPPQP